MSFTSFVLPWLCSCQLFSLFFFLSVCLSVSFCLSFSVFLSVCLSFCLFLSLFVFISVFLSSYFSFFHSFFLSFISFFLSFLLSLSSGSLSFCFPSLYRVIPVIFFSFSFVLSMLPSFSFLCFFVFLFSYSSSYHSLLWASLSFLSTLLTIIVRIPFCWSKEKENREVDRQASPLKRCEDGKRKIFFFFPILD